MRYIPALDGIRAIAIVAVLVFHVCPGAMSGGFTGVDVFFVLSGFLITSIILHDVAAGTFSMREFYLRRIQRLLPNLVVTVLATVLLWYFFLTHSTAGQVARQGVWTLFSVSNFYIWKHLGGYWGDAAEWSPLTHTWSLAVEEQFYMIFPALLLLLGRLRFLRTHTGLMLGTVASFVLCYFGTQSHPMATFYLLPTRIWELLLGAALGAFQFQSPIRSGQFARLRLGAGWAGLAAMTAGFFLIPQEAGFPGLVALIPTMGTLLVLVAACDDGTRLSGMLSHGSMVATGKVSYSLYLWHWPLITLGRYQAAMNGFPEIYGTMAGGLAGVGAGCLAYHVIEQPLRRRGPGRMWRFAVTGAGFALVALTSVLVSHARPRRVDGPQRFDPAVSSGVLYHVGVPQESGETGGTRVYDLTIPTVPERPHDLWRTGGIIHRYGERDPQVVVLGSSHALMYSPMVDGICRELGLSVAFLGMSGGTPAFFTTTANANFASQAEAAEFDVTRRRYLREWKPEVILVIDRWDSWVAPPYDFEQSLHSFLDEVSPWTGTVLFIAQVPVTTIGEQINLREFVQWRAGGSGPLPRLMPDPHEPLRRRAMEIAGKVGAGFPGFRILRPDRAFYEEDGSVRYASGRTFYYADDDHLTDAGAERVRPLFRSAIADAHAAAAKTGW